MTLSEYAAAAKLLTEDEITAKIGELEAAPHLGRFSRERAEILNAELQQIKRARRGEGRGE